MPPVGTSNPHGQRPRRTGRTRSRAARTDGPTPRSTVPATVWVPPPAAVGERWRAWVLSAIDRAFLPPQGRRIDLTAQLAAHLAAELHDQCPPAHGHSHREGPGDSDGHARVAGMGQSTPVAPYWAALICDQPAATAVTASTTPPTNAVPLTGPVPTDPASAGPIPVALAAEAGELAHLVVADLADLAFVDLAGAVADDRLGILAGRALRGGGILAVLTRCHHTSDTNVLIQRSQQRQTNGRRGAHAAADTPADSPADGPADGNASDEVGGGGAAQLRPRLVDPTGSVVASAQNADLLYLQHIVIPTCPLACLAAPERPDVPTETDRQPPRGHQSRLPRRALHRIAHADLLVFARPAGPTSVTRPVPTPARTPSSAGTPTDDLQQPGCGSSTGEGVRS